MEINLFAVSCGALAARLYEIRKRERGLLIELLHYLVELDKRRGYLELGFGTLFLFLREYLGYSKPAAFRRSTAARLQGRFPIVVDYLADGRLSMTTLVEMKDILDDDNHRELLDRAAGRTEDEVRELVASYRPRPEPRDLLPTFRDPGPAPVASPSRQAELPLGLPAPAPAPAPAAAVPETAPAATRPTATLTPISAERRVLRMTVGREFVADLKAVRALLGHSIPDGNLEEVVHECIRRTLRDGEKRRLGAGKKGLDQVSAGAEQGRYIPTPVRDAVWKRDGGRCTFVGSDGHRCDSTTRLQFHHIVAFAKGGRTTVENLTISCASHNHYLGELEFGRRAG